MSKILTFWSVNGGVGKTTLSSTLAYNLAKKNKYKRVLLLDFNLVNPDTDSYLKVEGNDLKDLYSYFSINKMTETVLSSHFKTYPRQPNFQILSGLYDFTYFDKFVSEHFTLIIELAKQMGYDYIVIDIDSSLNIDATLVALINADYVQVVSEGMYHSLKNTIRYLDNYLSQINVTDSKINMIINKYDNQIITKQEIKTILNSKRVFFVDNCRAIPRYVNEGTPFTECKEKQAKEVVAQVNEITDFLANN